MMSPALTPLVFLGWQLRALVASIRWGRTGAALHPIVRGAVILQWTHTFPHYRQSKRCKNTYLYTTLHFSLTSLHRGLASIPRLLTFSAPAPGSPPSPIFHFGLCSWFPSVQHRGCETPSYGWETPAERTDLTQVIRWCRCVEGARPSNADDRVKLYLEVVLKTNPGLGHTPQSPCHMPRSARPRSSVRVWATLHCERHFFCCFEVVL